MFEDIYVFTFHALAFTIIFEILKDLIYSVSNETTKLENLLQNAENESDSDSDSSDSMPSLIESANRFIRETERTNLNLNSSMLNRNYRTFDVIINND